MDVSLPPGFRFHPTDEELVDYYLTRRVYRRGLSSEAAVIADVDLYKCEPWDLPSKSLLPGGDLEWFFFSPRDRKYPNGSRTNRATDAGYWKATGRDRYVKKHNRTIGMKKTLVFYRGRAPQGQRTDWLMHEYRLEGDDVKKTSLSQDGYVLCRVFKKTALGPDNSPAPAEEFDVEQDESAYLDDVKPIIPSSLLPAPAQLAENMRGNMPPRGQIGSDSGNGTMVSSVESVDQPINESVDQPINVKSESDEDWSLFFGGYPPDLSDSPETRENENIAYNESDDGFTDAKLWDECNYLPAFDEYGLDSLLPPLEEEYTGPFEQEDQPVMQIRPRTPTEFATNCGPWTASRRVHLQKRLSTVPLAGEIKPLLDGATPSRTISCVNDNDQQPIIGTVQNTTIVSRVQSRQVEAPSDVEHEQTSRQQSKVTSLPSGSCAQGGNVLPAEEAGFTVTSGDKSSGPSLSTSVDHDRDSGASKAASDSGGSPRPSLAFGSGLSWIFSSASKFSSSEPKSKASLELPVGIGSIHVNAVIKCSCDKVDIQPHYQSELCDCYTASQGVYGLALPGSRERVQEQTVPVAGSVSKKGSGRGFLVFVMGLVSACCGLFVLGEFSKGACRVFTLVHSSSTRLVGDT